MAVTRSTKYNRKKFLATLGSAAAAGFLLNTVPFSSTHAQNKSRYQGQTEGHYLFADGLAYMNTGTLGPCRRETLNESLKMWEELESLPVKFFGSRRVSSYSLCMPGRDTGKI